MRIGVDARLFSEGRRSGVEEYAENILKNLFKLDTQNEYHLFFNAWQTRVGEKRIQGLSQAKNVRTHVLNIPNKILNASIVGLRYPHLDSLLNGVDVFFSPNLMFTALSRAVRHVITIHDLSFQLYPEFLTKKRRLWHTLVAPKRQTKNAHALIAVSEATRQDLITEYGVDPKRVHTIHSGLRSFTSVPKEDDREMLSELGIKKEYILFFATREPRKNMTALILAYKQLCREIQNAPTLVFAGIRGWMTEHVRREGGGVTPEILLVGEVTEKQKTVLYRNATCMVYPSLYEGFGFPPLEAMQAGTPVITSNNASLPEVVGDAALMIDPHDIMSLTNALRQFVQDSEMRAWYTEKGKQQIKKYSWENTARKTLECLIQQ